MIYFGLNKMSHPEKIQQPGQFAKPQKVKAINPSAKTVQRMIQRKNYYGFDKYNPNLNQYTSVNIGANPTDAGVLQSGILANDTMKNKLIEQYQNKVISEINRQQKQAEEETKEQADNQAIQQDVLFSYLTR
jgi:hypothetical protein